MKLRDRLRLARAVLFRRAEIVCELDHLAVLEMTRAIKPGHWLVERLPTVYVPEWYSAGFGRGGIGQDVLDLAAVRLGPDERVAVLRWR